MEKHFDLTITKDSFTSSRRANEIAQEAMLDGLYVVRTSVSKNTLDAEHVVKTYKSLSHVERAFRSLKTVDLQLRPIYHHKDDRIRAHVFICMLAYYTWNGTCGSDCERCYSMIAIAKSRKHHGRHQLLLRCDRSLRSKRTLRGERHQDIQCRAFKICFATWQR